MSDIKKRILVFSSINFEWDVLIRDLILSGLAGRKIKVFSLDVVAGKNGETEFHVIWETGGKPQIFYEKDLKFSGLAGSSFNIASHFSFLNMEVTLAAFVRYGQDDDIQERCKKLGIKFIPLWAAMNSKSFVLEDDYANPLVCMQKPWEVNVKFNRRKLMKNPWDVIISSSTQAHVDILKMNIELFKKNPEAIKALMPSLALINDQNEEIISLFKELISLTIIFQVNDSEAGRFLNPGSKESSKPIRQKELVLKLVDKLKVPIAIVTMGGAGAAVVATEGSSELAQDYYHQDALEMDIPTRSKVGCGDAFLTGFMYIYILLSLLDESCNNRWIILHHPFLKFAAHFAAGLAKRNIAVYGGNMSEDTRYKISKEDILKVREEVEKLWLEEKK